MAHQLDLICQRLLRPVPDPYVPPPKPATTWKKLKVCDVLTLRVDYRLPATQLRAGQRLRVAKLDSAGITLVGEPWDFEWRYEDPQWDTLFERAPRLKVVRQKKLGEAKKVVDPTPINQ